jgi:hypothetical protein
LPFGNAQISPAPVLGDPACATVDCVGAADAFCAIAVTAQRSGEFGDSTPE